jgi:hypothetical protein
MLPSPALAQAAASDDANPASDDMDVEPFPRIQTCRGRPRTPGGEPASDLALAVAGSSVSAHSAATSSSDSGAWPVSTTGAASAFRAMLEERVAVATVAGQRNADDGDSIIVRGSGDRARDVA